MYYQLLLSICLFVIAPNVVLAGNASFCRDRGDSYSIHGRFEDGRATLGLSKAGDAWVATYAMCSTRERAIRATEPAEPYRTATPARDGTRATQIMFDAARSPKKYSLSDVVALLNADGIQANIISYPREGCLCDSPKNWDHPSIEWSDDAGSEEK